MYGHFSYVHSILKNRQESDSFYDHYNQHFKSTMPCTDLRKCTRFKAAQQIKNIGAMKILPKPNCKLCMEESLTILKHLHDKNFWACRSKSTLPQFLLITNDTIIG